jgi:acetate kinase
MKVLVLNAGSSSLKASVAGLADGQIIDELFERIGEDGGGPADHGVAVTAMLGILSDAGIEVDAVGHRVVHGGETRCPP